MPEKLISLGGSHSWQGRSWDMGLNLLDARTWWCLHPQCFLLRQDSVPCHACDQGHSAVQ